MVTEHSNEIKISIIVPVLNEGQRLSSWVETLPITRPGTQWIFVDGNSRDGSFDALNQIPNKFPENQNIRILQTQPGRGKQMNAGAAIATGNLFLFLHSDTVLTNHHLEQLEKISHKKSNFWGCFRFALNAPGTGFRILEFLVDARVRFFHLPFGDQALFVTRKKWNLTGSFKEYPFMEDFEWVRRYNMESEPVYLNIPIYTSARQWQKRGLIQNSARNLYIQFKYLTGSPPDELSRLYYS